MNKDIVNIVNGLSEAFSDAARACTSNFSIIDSFELLKCYEIIANYCNTNNTAPGLNTYTQNNGLLYINGAPAGRVALMYNGPRYNTLPQGRDFEALILARQEAIYEGL